ncbi:MAG: dipeptidase PepE [Acidobacteriota bacterium]|nr:dipeptidase PepE [Acidobacteriota bacterium]
MRALLLSNSTNAGSETLGHAREAVGATLGGADRLVFVPYALHDWDAYTDHVGRALADVCQVTGVHRMSRDEWERAPAIYVGGGNTFRLLDRLQREGLVEVIRRLVGEGVPYMGASAGSVIAGPSIRTTNDMPIVEPASLQALGFLGFHLNCHYPDPPSGPRVFMGETRDERLAEFLEENDSEVVCLREGAWLEVDGDRVALGGPTGGKLFRRGAPISALNEGDTAASRQRWSL